MAIFDEIRKKSNVPFRVADVQALEQLRLIGVPNDAISFFEEHEPTECAEINRVRLWPITEMIAENIDYVPGADIRRWGYVVFATTLFGDAFCFATNGRLNADTAPVVLVAHDLDWEDSTMREMLANLAKPVAGNFWEFLEAFAAEKLDINPLYPERKP